MPVKSRLVKDGKKSREEKALLSEPLKSLQLEPQNGAEIGIEMDQVTDPLIRAVLKGNVCELENLLEREDPINNLDSDNKSCLHFACSYKSSNGGGDTASEMVAIILESIQERNSSSGGDDESRVRRFLNVQATSTGDTALHLAAEGKEEDLVTQLLLAGANVYLKNKKGKQAIQLIYKNCHEAIIPFFDRMVTFENELEEDGNLIFDLGLFMGEKLDVNDDLPYQPETNILVHCLSRKGDIRTDVFLHPAVWTLLFHKWKKLQGLLWFSLIFHVVWLLLYTVFVVDMYIIRCPYQISNSTLECDVGQHLSIKLELILILFLSACLVVKEIYEVCSIRRHYFLQRDNLGQLLLIGITISTALPVFLNWDEDGPAQIYSWQYQVAAFGVLLQWTLILSQIGKVPSQYDIYIEILSEVLKRFAMFSLTFASLIIGFFISIRVLMPQKPEFQPFPLGFIELLVMMVGEVNYDSVFFSAENAALVPFPTSAKLVYAGFVATVTIVFFNLFIAFTVSDVEDLLSPTYVSSLSNQFQQFHIIEKFMLSPKMQRFFMRINKSHWLENLLLTQTKKDATGRPILTFIHHAKKASFSKKMQEDLKNLAQKNLSESHKNIEDNEKTDDGNYNYDKETNVITQSQSSSSCSCSRQLEELKGQVGEILKLLQERKVDAQDIREISEADSL